MMPRQLNEDQGIILPIVLILTLVLMITGLVFVSLGVQENSLVRKEIAKRQAFYLAEAGTERLAVKLYAGEHRSIKSLPLQEGEDKYRLAVEETDLGEGHYRVKYYDGNPPDDLPYAISIGQVIRGGEVTAEKKIKVTLPFLAEPYEYGVSAGGSGSEDWTLQLRGTGDPYRSGSKEYGGKDTVEGDIYANVDVNLYEQASVYPPPDPNTYGLLGEVNSTQNIIKNPAEPAFTAGGGHAPEDLCHRYVEPILSVDLRGMEYAEEGNHTHDVGEIFGDIGSGHLPSGHELYNVVVKNPSDRSSECNNTTGDDYFFEPASIWGAGTPYTGETPLDLGDDRIYYVDGDVWFHSYPTYGFKVSGKALIVATGDIHICDNIEYADPENDLLGLVALGKYDGAGNLTTGGDIYFGDPRYGTTYTVSAFMFAGNDFLYNVDSVSGEYQRPETGFNVFGNWVGINKVSIIRDWYDAGHYETRWSWWRGGYYQVWVPDWNPAYFYITNSLTGEGEWRDWENKDDPENPPLEGQQLASLRHYQMKITYDERIRNPQTQPPGLPQGYGSGSIIFAGFTGWEEVK